VETEPARSTRFRESAAVVLVRGRGDSLEVFWVKRSDAVGYMPGFHAFVGGTVLPEDAELEVDGVAEGGTACCGRVRRVRSWRKPVSWWG